MYASAYKKLPENFAVNLRSRARTKIINSHTHPPPFSSLVAIAGKLEGRDWMMCERIYEIPYECIYKYDSEVSGMCAVCTTVL